MRKDLIKYNAVLSNKSKMPKNMYSLYSIYIMSGNMS